MNRPSLRVLLVAVCGWGWIAATPAHAAAPEKPIELTLRRQAKSAEGDAAATSETRQAIKPRETAILICDMWNEHWCTSATRRCGELAASMAPLIDAARARGVHIIHCPSDTMAFYKEHPARQRALTTPAAKAPMPIGGGCPLDKAREGELPIDDSDGGCDCLPPCPDVNQRAWSRQHPAITIADVDLITDSGQEVYNYLVQQGIKHIVYVGVHTNMCVLGRSFGIRQMTRLGFDTMLVRDLTDTMYNPRKRPMVPHAEGTELVVRHIERHWCPTTTSLSLREGLR